MDEQIWMDISRQLDTLINMLTEEKRSKKKMKTGRPSKEHIVVRFRNRYPDVTKTQCVRMTGLSIKTVSKYWNVGEKRESNCEEKEV
jgi:hypothetical protein